MADLPDLTALTDADLDALRVATLTEQERRTRIADGPTRLADDARALIAAGADPDSLRDAVEGALS